MRYTNPRPLSVPPPAPCVGTMHSAPPTRAIYPCEANAVCIVTVGAERRNLCVACAKHVLSGGTGPRSYDGR